MVQPHDIKIGKTKAGKDAQGNDAPRQDIVYKVLFNSSALWRLEEFNEGEAFWDFRGRLAKGGTRLRDGVALLAAGLEGARVAMFRKAPAWTLESVSALFDDETIADENLVDWMGENIRQLSRWFMEGMNRGPINGLPAIGVAAPQAAAGPGGGLPLAATPSGSDTSPDASNPA